MTWNDIGLLVCGAGIAAIGYVGKRLIQGDWVTERMDRRARALDLHMKMKSQGVALPDLDRLAANLTARRERKREVEDAVSVEIGSKRVSGQAGPCETQAAMNMLAASDLQIARAKMDKAYTELAFHLDVASLPHLERAQQAWETFAESDARLSASICDGGTAWPAVYNFELERLTISRIADLMTEMEPRKAL